MADPASGLCVAIATRNNIATIKRTVESVADLADRVVIVDSGSTDGTDEWCGDHGCEVVGREWPGMVAQRQFCLDHCASFDWILLLDSDESLEPDLAADIREAVERNETAFDGYAFNRKVFFKGAWLHHVFQPEWRLRLVRGGMASVGGASGSAGGHDRLSVPGRVGRLKGDCRHDSWRDLSDILDRGIAYGRRSAETGQRGGSLRKLLLNPPAAFLKQMVLRRGFLDGWRGFVVSGGVAAGTFMKHLLIHEARHRGNDQ
jgi:glycosyltransferase involved in cell wall biosynthesis